MTPTCSLLSLGSIMFRALGCSVLRSTISVTWWWGVRWILASYVVSWRLSGLTDGESHYRLGRLALQLFVLPSASVSTRVESSGFAQHE
jgi:hypothetical protein